MSSDVIGLAIVVAPIVAFLVAQNRFERRQEAAMSLRAEIYAGARHALHGDSLLAIDVDLPTAWRAGQVRLSTPSGYESLIGLASGAVLSRVPNGYDVVIHCGGAS